MILEEMFNGFNIVINYDMLGKILHDIITSMSLMNLW